MGTVSFVSKENTPSKWTTKDCCTISKPLCKDKSKKILKGRKDYIKLCTLRNNRVTLHVDDEA